ncbi:A(2,3)-sialyltransferase [Deerpox virus W-848-83]|uniref:A(2,3)-sialyltransferase n=1 Tax=Deerpox virus (strain Mule deer/United States/W-848-83/1983) TaxID=305674 RepID=Q08FK2_DPV83|nr:A(2,3)-sialyltransferase [Deerpox virus W-848-83]ABI99305.1 A(2,3)-sialyltransferase [Deerpox virus W-848-83]
MRIRINKKELYILILLIILFILSHIYKTLYTISECMESFYVDYDFIFLNKKLITHINKKNLPYGLLGVEHQINNLLSIANVTDIPTHIKHIRCKKCIVVGNSHNLVNSKLGHKINSHNIVIRINDAPIHNFEEDVGNITTIRLFYPESAQENAKIENQKDTLFVMIPFKKGDLYWLYNILNKRRINPRLFWKPPIKTWDIDKKQIRILNPYFAYTAMNLLKDVSKKETEPVPTTGILAIIMSLYMCNSVSIVGFGYPDNSYTPIHYYNNSTLNNMVSTIHNLNSEYILIKKLINENFINALQ